jgi:hypothetical protein
LPLPFGELAIAAIVTLAARLQRGLRGQIETRSDADCFRRMSAVQPGRLLSSNSSLHVPVNGDGDVMDQPGVPLLVRLQVRG